MTEETQHATAEEPAIASSPAEPEPLHTHRHPAWTYFMTPAAVVIGSIIIAAVLWWTREDGGGDGRAAVQQPGGASTQAAGATATPAGSGSGAANVLLAFTSYAKELGLDESKFTQCMVSNGKQNEALINSHLQRGSQLGVTGTPTFFINNKKLVGAQPAAIFDEIVQKELQGSPTSLDAYSDAVKALANRSPAYFEIMPSKPDITGGNVEGSPNAKVVIAEFSDFQCPFCKRWVDDNMKRVRASLGDNVALVFLHFPIVQIHPNAGNASAAAICAGEQGKFAEMHDVLFAKQNEWAKLPAQ